MSIKPLPSAADLRRLLKYDPIDGTLRWRWLDDASFKRNSQFAECIAGSINHDGYRYINIEGLSFAAHRIVWAIVTGDDPGGEIDHRNGARSDNRFGNLRCSCRRGNNLNRANWGSAPKGVYYNKSKDRYIAQININGQRKHIGHFHTPEQAAEAYEFMADLYFGEFACYDR